jgi:hypothetical protein
VLLVAPGRPRGNGVPSPRRGRVRSSVGPRARVCGERRRRLCNGAQAVAAGPWASAAGPRAVAAGPRASANVPRGGSWKLRGAFAAKRAAYVPGGWGGGLVGTFADGLACACCVMGNENDVLDHGRGSSRDVGLKRADSAPSRPPSRNRPRAWSRVQVPPIPHCLLRCPPFVAPPAPTRTATHPPRQPANAHSPRPPAPAPSERTTQRTAATSSWAARRRTAPARRRRARATRRSRRRAGRRHRAGR